MDASGLASAELRSALAPLSTLEELLRWAFGRAPPGTDAEVVIQDEFTHDVVLALGETWLVFDST